MIDYLYYKLYAYTLKTGYASIVHFAAPGYVALLFTFNIGQINLFMTKLDLVPFIFINKSYALVIYIIITCLSILYYRLNYTRIIKKYSEETKIRKRRGSIIVLFYVLVTFALIFIIAFYKPGKVYIQE
jgi:uncharacterized membrane protein YidH (DUF202 family)